VPVKLACGAKKITFKAFGRLRLTSRVKLKALLHRVRFINMKKTKAKKKISKKMLGRMPSNKSKNSKVKKLIKLAMQKKSKKAKKKRR
jgi:hypothetical protein